MELDDDATEELETATDEELRELDIELLLDELLEELTEDILELDVAINELDLDDEETVT